MMLDGKAWLAVFASINPKGVLSGWEHEIDATLNTLARHFGQFQASNFLHFFSIKMYLYFDHIFD